MIGTGPAEVLPKIGTMTMIVLIITATAIMGMTMMRITTVTAATMAMDKEGVTMAAALVKNIMTGI